MKKLAILGAGSWGLTLAWIIACHKNPVDQMVLWSHTPAKIEALKANRTVTFPVPVTLPDSVGLTSDLAEAISGADAVILVVTSQATRQVAQAMKETGVLPRHCVLLNASKGIELNTLLPMSKVLDEVLPNNPQAVLSGPTLAKEILAGLPTACCIASPDIAVAEGLQKYLSCSQKFRLYSNTDMIGVEVGGAVKNVFAIASGFMQAKGLGENARSALLTRGLAEMARLCMAMGAQEQTIYGLSGLGDLLATCNSPNSRNYQVGFRLGKDERLADILADMRVAAEGVQTAYAVGQLAKRYEIDMPVVELVINSLEGAYISDEMMIKSLMSRKLRAE
jgi:glycerol-3-phosphate dehydrogenase (NAD(P)+)